ncbi:M14 family metallopeptidase, partial [Hydrocarboniphaga effusa]
LDLLTIGTPGEGKRKLWIIARQHPGETMAEWLVEGLLKRLLNLGDHAGDPLGHKLLQHAVFYVVPNMNPDGAALGNLRTNAVGANLNREWMDPSAERSPEVLAVREAIAQSGCDFFLDVHGDEALPYVFVDGCGGLPTFDDAQAAEQKAFLQRFLRASPDFQTQHGYPSNHFREEVLKLATKYIGYRYRCLALTLELPFKDNANDPRPETGWNGARSAALGAALVSALYWHVVPGADI